MADFSNIIQEINDDINTNGVGAITGAKLNEVLRDMVASVNAEKQDKLTIYTEDVENERAEINTSLFAVNAEVMRVLCAFFSLYFSDETGLEVKTTSNSCSFKFNNEEFVVKYEDKWLLSFSKTGFRVQLHDGEDPYAMTFDINNGLVFGSVNIGMQLDSLQQNKQDTISDLSTIRSGAAAGATAYQKPSGGIPKTDLASGVQTSLGKADTAVQQVAVGTTTTGNAGTNASVTNSGTSTAPVLNFTIPRGADGQDGADAVNPFKGWWPDLAALKAAHTATAGDSAYVKDASPATTWSIYVYDSTASSDNYWADSGIDADTSNVQTFASGEEVNEVHIINDLNTGGVHDVLSAEQGKKMLTKELQELTEREQIVVRDNIGVDVALYGRKKNYYENRRVESGVITYYEGVGVSDFIACKSGDVIIWRFGGTGSGYIRFDLYDSHKTYLGAYSSSGYTDSRTITISDESYAYMRIGFHLQKDGVANEKPININGIDYVLHGYEKGYDKSVEIEERKWKPLPLGSLINCDTSESGSLVHNPTYDPIRVTTQSNVCVPFQGCKIRHRITDETPYVLTGYWWVGTSNGAHTALQELFADGSIITLPNNALCIRPVFRAYTTSPSSYDVQISASDIQDLIDEGKIAIEYYDDNDEDVITRNNATLINQQALRRLLITENGALNGMDSMPIFAHITDLHGDAPRWLNFMEYCDKYGVDFALETGDAVMYLASDASKYIYDFANEHNTDVIACIGNHEAFPTGSSTLFADNLSDLATKYEYLASAGTTTTKCYYFKDYDAKKIRVIVLNQHEDGVYRRRIGQAQVDWFITTLLSTPVGYGVVIAYHAPEDKVVAESPYDVFRQPMPNTGATYEANGGYVDKRVISLLIDAFISRTSVNFTYNDHSATYNGDSDVTTQTVSVVADFSDVDESTEFICYVCGHRHEDWIGYYDHSTNKQLCLCITTGNALYGDSTNPAWSNQSDLPRGGVGVSQDAFCVYAIDRLNGNVKIMRVGSTVTQMMVKREMMVIPYKD